MDGLTKFEKEFDKPRTKWSKADWRKVAHDLAGVEPVRTEGRKTKTDKQKYESEQNLLAAQFWRDQNVETTSVFDGEVGTVQKRSRRLTKKEATEAVLNQALTRAGVKLKDEKILLKKQSTCTKYPSNAKK